MVIKRDSVPSPFNARLRRLTEVRLLAALGGGLALLAALFSKRKVEAHQASEQPPLGSRINLVLLKKSPVCCFLSLGTEMSVNVLDTDLLGAGQFNIQSWTAFAGRCLFSAVMIGAGRSPRLRLRFSPLNPADSAVFPCSVRRARLQDRTLINVLGG